MIIFINYLYSYDLKSAKYYNKVYNELFYSIQIGNVKLSLQFAPNLCHPSGETEFQTIYRFCLKFANEMKI